MSTKDTIGRTRFAGGMRVVREHLEHLQSISIEADLRLREAFGAGRVSHGLRVSPAGPNRVAVEPGFAIDGGLRPLVLPEPVELDLPSSGARRLVLSHRLRGEMPFVGTPTLFFDEVVLELREGAPPYADGGVACALVHAEEPQARVHQLGDAYLPAPDHGHTGTFKLGADQRWRYDGAPLGLGATDFDSGSLRMDPGQCRELDHGLGTRDLLAVLEALQDGAAITRGLGTDYWYEIHSEDSIRACRGPVSTTFPEELHLRLRLWAPGITHAPPLAPSRRPVADAGPDLDVDGTRPFALDAGASRAFGDRTIARYRWTRLN